MTVRAFALMAEPLNAQDTGQTAFERFERSPDCTLLVVVDSNQHPIGQIERNSFLLNLASYYGRAIYANRPVSLVMEPANLLVEADANAADFAETALASHLDDLLKGFVIVEQGRYFGVGGVIDLLRATMRERTLHAHQMAELAESLRCSNRDLQRQTVMSEAVIEHIPSLIALRRKTDNNIRLINHTGAAMMGIAQEQAVGCSVAKLDQPKLAWQIRSLDRQMAACAPGAARDMAFTPLDGRPPRILRVMNVPLVMPDDGEVFTLTIAEDVTEVRKATTRIEELAHFDMLTGLPNRIQLHNRLIAMLDERDPDDAHEVALLAIDLDRFKMVNDTFGHHAGDAVLREMAQRLRSGLRSDDLPVRLGGDEFAVVISAPMVGALAEKVADRLIESMKQPFHIGEKVLHLGGSIGIAIYPRDCEDATALMKYADMALYRAKADGKGVWRRFLPDMREGLEQRSAMEMDLRLALARDQLEVHLQPQLDIALDRITGFECLMRWRHPERGLVPPVIFIPLAEDIGLINQLGEWIINEACRIATTLPSDLSVAVNISAVQFRMEGLVDNVQKALARSGLDAQRLELEITESVLIHDEDQVMKCVADLRGIGVRIALDDFGTGFASFAYLQRFAFDKIKIDRSFVQGLPHDQSSRAIVSAVTVLGKQLGAVITAEGVETDIQLEALRQLGCTQVQGYLIGKPAINPHQFLAASPPVQEVA